MKILASLIFGFLIFFTESDSTQCPTGSYEVPNEDTCLYFINETVFFVDVIHRCYALGAIPVKIQNVFENAIILGLISTIDNDLTPYIGIERKPNNVWTYDDGSALVYQNWAVDEPNNSSNTSVCGTIDLQGKWHSVECSFARPFICSSSGKVQPTGVQPTAGPTTKLSTMGVPSTAVPTGICPSDWIYFNVTSQCYYLQNFTYPDGFHWPLYDWKTAEALCQEKGAHLVSIHSDAENNFIYDLISSNVSALTFAVPTGFPCNYQWVWIGYFGPAVLGFGNWTDGSPADYFGHEPLMRTDFVWDMANDDSCKMKDWGCDYPKSTFARFICKMSPMNLIQEKN